MCTILVFHQVHPSFPLVIAANRDEFYSRRTTGPGVLSTHPRVIGGRDLERGGTWMGFAEGGLFVGITNQRTLAPPQPAKRSRGEIVMTALRSRTVEEIEKMLSKLDARYYGPFNLMFGDARALRVAYAREGDPYIRAHEVPPGVWVLPNDTLASRELPKVRRTEELARPLIEHPWYALTPELHLLLADHKLPPIDEVAEPPPGSWLSREMIHNLQSICIHTPQYGTRSATIAAVAKEGLVHYYFAGGPPCMTSLVDYTYLMSS
jgi:uncharacterized protein with NRDE domain